MQHKKIKVEVLNNFEIETKAVDIIKYKSNEWANRNDLVVIERPLEIILQYFFKNRWHKEKIIVTMCTPGDDERLALGFLFSEGIIGTYSDTDSFYKYDENAIIIKLKKTFKFDVGEIGRSFISNASCGICGKTSIESIKKHSCYFPKKGLPQITVKTILQLTNKLNKIQKVFQQTGGIHATALFDASGNLIQIKEDVGRHNALDKLIGDRLIAKALPLRDHILLLSGRVSFELVQKAMMAGIPIIIAVGAPSSLAIQLAKEADITLIGFLKKESFNVYCGEERVLKSAD